MNSHLRRVLLVIIVLSVAAIGVRGFMVWNKTRDVLPKFSPVPEGIRGPAFTLAGVTVGLTTLSETKALTERFGWACSDASMRGLMEKGRQETQAKIKAAEEAGQDPDTVSGASRAYYYSKKERNPQVQWNCEDVDLTPTGEPNLKGAVGNVLFIFDSNDIPVRFVVVSRKFRSQRLAVEARAASLLKFSSLGEPTERIREPNLDPTQKAFDRHISVSVTWTFADRRASVSVMNFGPARGIDVSERFEVPWPVEVAPPPQ